MNKLKTNNPANFITYTKIQRPQTEPQQINTIFIAILVSVELTNQYKTL